MLHGAMFPPDVPLGIQAKEFHLGFIRPENLVVSMYADDSTLCMSATTATERIATLNKELQLVSEWVARNKLVLNIYKTKSIVFGTSHSLNPKPQLNLVINNVEIEQLEVLLHSTVMVETYLYNSS
jgi:hypothetical protein